MLVQNFEHTALETSYRTGISRTTKSDPPNFLLDAIERRGIFGEVTTPATHDSQSAPSLILEGKSLVEARDPWWTWAQVIDLMAHAWILPTLGRSWITFGEFMLFDSNRTLIQSWSFRHEDRYLGTVPWAWGHGGAEDFGFDVERMESAVDEAVERLSQDLLGTAATEGDGR